MSSPSPSPSPIAPTATPPPHTAAPPPPPRKFPALCWNQEESLALINCYREKWYSLRRRNLRIADWEAVAEEVNRRCPNQSPAKTSAQCRHKMEKLRKRYRTEKQRIMSLPNNNGRFYGSSWVLFDLIDSMEIGSAGVHPNNNNHIPEISNVCDVDLDVKPFSMNHLNMNTNMNMNMNTNTNDCNGKRHDWNKCFDDLMLGKSQNHEFDVRSRSAAHHIQLNAKNHHNNRHEYSGDLSNDFDAPPGGFKRKSSNYDQYDGEMFLVRKESGGRMRERERERERVSVAREMAASIKMLGEGLIKMEKMKIEMMRDIEKMRMEMEMKRSEMILESQHLIVNAFVEGLLKNKKVKVTRID